MNFFDCAAVTVGGGNLRCALRHSVPLAVLWAALALPWAGEAQAQDAHYWSTQYGNRSRLLAGAVIGSVDDASSVYYNPGALALLEKAELLLGGNVFQYTNVTYEGAVAGELDLDSNRFKSVPAMLAGEFPFKFLGKNRLAYSYLVRADFDFRIRERGVLTGEDVDLPGLETVNGDVVLDQNLTESWGGSPGPGSWANGDSASASSSPCERSASTSGLRCRRRAPKMGSWCRCKAVISGTSRGASSGSLA